MSDTMTPPREAAIPPAAPAERPAPPDNQQKLAEPPKPERDRLLDLLAKFEKVTALVGSKQQDPGVAKAMERLVQQAAEPGHTEQPLFRTQVAYVLQDVEKMAGTVSIPTELRAEMTRLAATSPGLENARMEALVRSTPDIDDRGVIRDVRRAAASIASLGDQQDSPQARETIEVLENRVNLAARFPSHEAPAQTEKLAKVGAEHAAKIIAPDATARISPEAPGEKVRAVPSPGDIATTKLSPKLENASQATDGVQAAVTSAARSKGLLSSIMDNARTPSAGREPWEPPPIGMKLRVQSFEAALANGRTDQNIRAAEKSGQKLMQAMETFMTGPGAGVLGKIEAAASTEPGGMQAVMAEMQPGGRYASLRSEFDNALQQDRAFAASFNAVEKAAGAYGQDRMVLGADFQGRKLDASQLDARFQTADAAIGEAAEKIPGRAPGQNIHGRDGGEGRRNAVQGGRSRPPDIRQGCRGGPEVVVVAQPRAVAPASRLRPAAFASCSRILAPHEPCEDAMRRPWTLLLLPMLLCAAGVAHAATTPNGNAYQATWSALSPGNDWAAQVLWSLFPIGSGTGLTGIGAASTVIGKMVGQLTGYIMALAIVFVAYSTILQIHRAAETGRVLSSTTSSWAPVRLVLALAMMFPLPSGFSSGQAVVMQVAMWGIGMGRAVYASAIQAVGPDAVPIAQPMIPGTKTIVAGLMQNELCRALINVASGNPNLVPAPVPVTNTATDESGMSSGYVSWIYGMSTGDGIGTPICGTVTLRQSNPNARNLAGVSVDMTAKQAGHADQHPDHRHQARCADRGPAVLEHPPGRVAQPADEHLDQGHRRLHHPADQRGQQRHERAAQRHGHRRCGARRQHRNHRQPAEAVRPRLDPSRRLLRRDRPAERPDAVAALRRADGVGTKLPGPRSQPGCRPGTLGAVAADVPDRTEQLCADRGQHRRARRQLGPVHRRHAWRRRRQRHRAGHAQPAPQRAHPERHRLRHVPYVRHRVDRPRLPRSSNSARPSR